jgi:hypothetical protein
MLRTRRALILVGLLLMVVGAIDPLEGSLFVLAGSAMATVGAYLEHSRRRQLLTWAFGLVAVGVVSLIVLSVVLFTGGRPGVFSWWLLLLVPYVVGWVMGVAGAGLGLVDTLEGADGTGTPAPR